MIPRKHNFLFQTAMIFITAIFSNVLVDLGSEGNLDRMLNRPLLFFGGALALSAIGGFIMVKVIEKTGQKGK